MLGFRLATHELANWAYPEQDLGAIDRDIRNAMELGKKSSKASAEARTGRQQKDGTAETGADEGKKVGQE